MASVDFSLSGKMNNMVFVTRNGKIFARAIPASVKQTAGTKQRSRNFGLASAAGKAMRFRLLSVLPQPKNRSMQVRFAGAIAKWLQTTDIPALPSAVKLPFLSDFSFSEKTTFYQRCNISPVVTECTTIVIAIYLPAFTPAKHISAPSNTKSVQLNINVVSCKLSDASITGSDAKAIEFLYNKETIEAQTLYFNVPSLPGCLLLSVANIKYKMSNGSVNNTSSFMPCSIIDARYNSL